MNKFIRETMGSIIIVYTTEILIVCIWRKKIGMCWIEQNWLVKFHVKVKMITRKANFYGFFLAPKKYVLTINESGIVEQHMTFKGFNDSKVFLDRSQFLTMLEGKKNQLCYQDRGKNHLIPEILIPPKLRRGNECKDRILCTTCNNQINENKDFEANLNESKRHPPNEFGHMLPYYNL